MVGKGSLSHNSRKFNAENTDPTRSHLNIEYCNEDIRTVYHQLFDEAVLRYNAKQTRKDRRIGDYYEKIRSGKQEKPFHELVLQIGNRDNCSSTSPEGHQAAQILDAYMKEFQQRNPTLRVFSAHLHLDEATPHLHIDFVPYTTGSKRGLDTRVSLKQALAALGFRGGTRGDTEWNQWVNAEKTQLAAIMERHDIQWEQKGTHEEHLSVLEYKKQERAKEVTALETQCSTLEQTVQQMEEEANMATQKAEIAQQSLDQVTAQMDKVQQFAATHVRPPEEWLPEPNRLESAKAYRKRVLPLVQRLVKLLLPLYARYLELKTKCSRLTTRNLDLEGRLTHVADTLSKSRAENKLLRSKVSDLEQITAVLGQETIHTALQTAKQQEAAHQNENRKNRTSRADER
jgi:hypothetical protein